MRPQLQLRRCPGRGARVVAAAALAAIKNPAFTLATPAKTKGYVRGEEKSREEQSREEQSRAEQSRAEQSIAINHHHDRDLPSSSRPRFFSCKRNSTRDPSPKKTNHKKTKTKTKPEPPPRPCKLYATG
jgi:hypothetical protein